jgi:hypothetical protein
MCSTDRELLVVLRISIFRQQSEHSLESRKRQIMHTKETDIMRVPPENPLWITGRSDEVCMTENDVCMMYMYGGKKKKRTTHTPTYAHMQES